MKIWNGLNSRMYMPACTETILIRDDLCSTQKVGTLSRLLRYVSTGRTCFCVCCSLKYPGTFMKVKPHGGFCCSCLSDYSIPDTGTISGFVIATDNEFHWITLCIPWNMSLTQRSVNMDPKIRL